jgi:hypothetical protein
MSEVEANTKYALAKDLILYLCSVLVVDKPKEEALIYLANAFLVWSRRVEENITKYKEHDLKNMMEMEHCQDTEDVINILLDVHTTPSAVITQGFLEEITAYVKQVLIDSK